MMFNQLGLIGCGLMGGSFALAMKRAGLVQRVIGYSKSPSTTERAKKLGVIDEEAAARAGLEEAFAKFGLALHLGSDSLLEPDHLRSRQESDHRQSEVDQAITDRTRRFVE